MMLGKIFDMQIEPQRRKERKGLQRRPLLSFVSMSGRVAGVETGGTDQGMKLVASPFFASSRLCGEGNPRCF
jgi:hypothetical protein